MQMLSNAAVLDIWERGYRRDRTGRALALLSAACPGLADDALANVTIARRDAAILALRQTTAGVRMPAYVDCPRCAERLEFEFDSGQIDVASAERGAKGAREERAPVAPSLDRPSPTASEAILVGGLRFRAPTSADLMAVVAIGAGDAEADDQAAGRALAQRCCLDPRPDIDWSGALLDEVEGALGRLDAAGDIELSLSCVACGHAWTTALDIPSYFWEEIAERAARLLDDIHLLASRYGWSEAQILALSEPRRRAYLDRCDS